MQLAIHTEQPPEYASKRVKHESAHRGTGGAVVDHPLWFKRKTGRSAPIFVNKKDRASAKQQQRSELQAAKRVVPWTRLNPSDYNFRSWAAHESKELLRAGCVYEYARESRKLRCLLALINSAFQKAKQAEKTQSPPPFHSLQFLSLSFEGLRYKDALLQLGGWFGWLRKFTDELADNKSFAELCKENREQLNESFSTLASYFHAPKAVELAFPNLNESLVEPRLLWPWQAPDVRHRNIENDVIMTIRIRLRDFTNREIGKAMEELASMLLPSTEKEPTRKGTGKRDSVRSWLDALSALRLASWYPVYPPGSRAGLKTIRGGLTAFDHFNDIRLGGRKPVDESNFYSHIREARKIVEAFLFGEGAENAQSWTGRQSVTK